VRSSLFGLLIALGFSYAACDSGSETANSACPTGQTLCENRCVNGTYCLPLPGTGGSGTTTILPVDPGPFSSPDCTDTASASGKVSAQYGGANIPTGAGKSYYLLSNWWGLFEGQSINYQGLSFTVSNPQGAGVTDGSGNPMGYPTLFIGSYAGHTTTNSNLPKLVSTIQSVPTVFATNAADQSIANHNAAYDVWFTDTSKPLTASDYSPPTRGAYLMVWMFDPTNRQPRGTKARRAATIPGVEGTWDVWVDPSTPPCISYVSVQPRNGLAFDLNKFIQDSVTNKHGITSSMYLSVVFAGFEIWGGADGVQVKNFCAQVN
jgi:hypothetical protein